MEIECKVILPTASDVSALLTLLGQPLAEERQENHFFDSPDDSLRKNHSALRLRRVHGNPLAECSLKEDSETSHGTTLRWGTRASVPETLANEILQHPDRLLWEEAETQTEKLKKVQSTNKKETDVEGSKEAQHEGNEQQVEKDSLKQKRSMAAVPTQNPVSTVLRSKYQIETLHYLGGFRNYRRVFAYPNPVVQPHGLLVKLDEVTFPFHTSLFEVEVSGIVVPMGDVLEEFCTRLQEANVGYRKSEGSKYETFVKGKANAMMSCDIRNTETSQGATK